MMIYKDIDEYFYDKIYQIYVISTSDFKTYKYKLRLKYFSKYDFTTAAYNSHFYFHIHNCFQNLSVLYLNNIGRYNFNSLLSIRLFSSIK